MKLLKLQNRSNDVRLLEMWNSKICEYVQILKVEKLLKVVNFLRNLNFWLLWNWQNKELLKIVNCAGSCKIDEIKM